MEQYSIVSTRNFKENKDRQAIFGTALSAIIVAAGLALISSIPYFALTSPSRIPHRIVEDIESSEDVMWFRKKDKKPVRNQDPYPNDIAEDEYITKLKLNDGPHEPPERPGVLLLRDCWTTKQSKEREDNGVW